MKALVKRLSPLPIVSFEDPSEVVAGWFLGVPSFCCNKLGRSQGECIAFYDGLKECPKGCLHLCPYGFSAYVMEIDGQKYAVTCFIPFPRQNDERERNRAKNHKAYKMSMNSIRAIEKNLIKVVKESQETIQREMGNHLSALHEIRKYNRTIRQEAERLYRRAGVSDDKTKATLERIERSAGLMAGQFEILELLANEGIARLELKAQSEIYKLFDKSVHIHEVLAEKKNVTLKISGDSPECLVCDKTFPIIATVLVENAVKYAVPNSIVSVKITQCSRKNCRIEVRNQGVRKEGLGDIFAKGVTGEVDGSGHGFGLYLANLVAEQHGTSISLDVQPVRNEEIANYIFELKMETIA